MIINSHVHVNTDENYFFYKDYGVARLLQEMQENKIEMAFPTLNPKIEIFRCPRDCSMHCSLFLKEKTISSSNGNENVKMNFLLNINLPKNNNLNLCNCKQPNRHRVEILEENGTLVIHCKTCGKTISTSSIDPLRKYNLDLIHLTKPYRKKLKPILYLSLCTATIQSEIDFFETNYPKDFIGFKLHPWNDQVSVTNFKLYTSKPILIHTGIRELENAQNAITFAKNNFPIKVQIAHAAALDEECLKQISQMENVVVDCCPSVFMYKSKETSLFHPQDILSPEDIYYKVLDFLPNNKIVFGTDSPWGNSRDELKVLSNLKILKKQKIKLCIRM